MIVGLLREFENPLNLWLIVWMCVDESVGRSADRCVGEWVKVCGRVWVNVCGGVGEIVWTIG